MVRLDSGKIPCWWEKVDTPQGVTRRRRRRQRGMVLMATISLALFLGINFMQPNRFPVEFALYWVMVLLMILWLCLLAVADVRHTLFLHRRWSQERARSYLANYLQTLEQQGHARQQQADSEIK